MALGNEVDRQPVTSTRVMAAMVVNNCAAQLSTAPTSPTFQVVEWVATHTFFAHDPMTGPAIQGGSLLTVYITSTSVLSHTMSALLLSQYGLPNARFRRRGPRSAAI